MSTFRIMPLVDESCMDRPSSTHSEKVGRYLFSPCALGWGEAIGLGAAIDYLSEIAIGMRKIHDYESKLKSIGAQDSDVLENLKPAVRKRVEVLRDIQVKDVIVLFIVC
ncbi:hypothetical protein Tco_1347605 [Tanacetum coccineum]